MTVTTRNKLYTRRRMLGMSSALLVSAILAACGEEDNEATGGAGSGDSAATTTPTEVPPTATEVSIEYPTEPDAAVLKIELEGGLTSIETKLSRVPLIAIYGDGRVFTLGPQIEIFPQPAEVPLQVAKLSPDGIQAILAEAKQAGLLDGDDYYRLDGITDLATTVFIVTANGQTTMTSVYGLNVEDGEIAIPDDQRELRQTLRKFRDKAASYSEWLPPEAILEPVSDYQPDRLQIVTYPYTIGDREIEPQQLDWPLETPPGEIGEPFVYPGLEARCTVLEGEQLATMMAAIQQANTLTKWMFEGEPYAVVNRPLLPDQEGCISPGAGDDVGDQPEGPYNYPTAPDAVVVRYELVGGFAPAQQHLTEMPVFSLFGDGLAVQPGPQIAIYPPPALPSLIFKTLTPAGIEAILAQADIAGLLQGDQQWLGLSDRVADAFTGVLTLTVNGETSQIEVYAPGMTDLEVSDDLSDEELEFRARFSAFIEQLHNLESWLPADAIAEPEDEYPLQRLQIVSQPADLAPPSDPSVEPDQVEWPLDRPLTELGEPVKVVEDGRCFVLEGEDFKTVMDALRDATAITRWSSNGKLYVLYPRPLLPNEVGCEFGG